jgi:hypothetical protein
MDVAIWTAMVRYPSYKNVWNISHCTLLVGVVLTGTVRPFTIVFDMYLAGCVNIPKKASRENGNRIFFIVDMCQVKIGIHVISKSMIADLEAYMSVATL